ncbi:SMP-30/gluconolactonase/LRE family protein [Pseudomonas indica]|uniref:Gluconolactonase n=1 Tax=Pseudomonas indica TaxID=137658 RepID=A0A1G8TJS9_9PSED|nr:SMP-30/gluconolactonase/LRE family protein [Pseudomonas indica]SDJ41822.1 gluconolactonase [Pseudomonas indica]
MSPHFIAYSEAFHDVTGPDPRFFTLVETNAHEGPVYVRDEDALYFTTVPQNVEVPLPGFQRVDIKRVSLAGEIFPLPAEAVTTVRANANMANGMTLDLEGNLVICEQGSKTEPARITRMSQQGGAVETLVDQWCGLRFNSPNDVVVKSDGTVWFTDPSYGALQGFKDAPLLGDFVYRYDPRSGMLSVVADGFDKPNGLAFSPDESVFYVTDSGAIQGPGSYVVDRPHHIRAFDVRGGRHLANERLFAVVAPGIPDGIKLDSAGRVYSSSASGIQVFEPCGDLIGEIVAPGVANFCFGGQGNDTLFILADTVIWAARIQAVGAARS